MNKGDILEIERRLSKPVGLELSVNDLRIIVGCFSALAYWSEVYDEAQLDPEGLMLKDRLEGLYRDEVLGPAAFGTLAAELSA
jgi:hypothetical protein